MKLTLFLLAAVCSYGATIASSTCSADVTTINLSTREETYHHSVSSGTSTSCRLLTLGALITVDQTASFTLNSSGGSGVLHVEGVARPDLTVPGDPVYASTLSLDGMANWDFAFSTLGPSRAGFIILTGNYSQSRDTDNYVSSTATLSLSNSSSQLVHTYCTLEGSMDNTCSGSRNGAIMFKLPVTLGDNLVLSVGDELNGKLLTTLIPYGMTIENLAFSFSVFEADGVTPAGVTSVPEPATCGITGVLLLVLVSLAVRRKYQTLA